MKSKIIILLILTFSLVTNLFSQSDILLDTIYWKESKHANYGICGVYNPSLKIIEWKDTKYPNHGVCGVYNPEIKTTEWKESKYSNYKVFGVYNPEAKNVEWKESKYSKYDLCGVSTFISQPSLSNASIIFDERKK